MKYLITILLLFVFILFSQNVKANSLFNERYTNFIEETINKLDPHNEKNIDENWYDIQKILYSYQSERKYDKNFIKLENILHEYFTDNITDTNFFCFTHYIKTCEKTGIKTHYNYILKLINDPGKLKKKYFAVLKVIIPAAMKKDLIEKTRTVLVKIILSPNGKLESCYPEFPINHPFLKKIGDDLRKIFYYSYSNLSIKDGKEIGIKILDSDNIGIDNKKLFIETLLFFNKKFYTPLLKEYYNYLSKNKKTEENIELLNLLKKITKKI